MDSADAPVRRTRSGRTIAESPPKPVRKSRKKNVEQVSEEVEEVSKMTETTELSDAEAVEPAEIIEQSDNAVEAEDMQTECAEYIQEEAMETEIPVPMEEPSNEDSNSMMNDFNSFKGAESSSDAMNNESNSCFDDGNEISENGRQDDEDSVNRQVQSGPDPDAENISEDELPTVQAVKVPEAEEVSDEELPGPKRAELPADTEVVSEEELETTKTNKRKLEEEEEGAGGADDESANKKQALEKSGETDEQKDKQKKLPELDKYWKAVNDDPSDFTGWTYLLQYVDQENDTEAAREAYDAFLSHYPYCYGYWRKYADYEKRKGNKKKCEEVFERGLKAIPLSVDLWIHYLTYARTAKPDDEDFIRTQFERSLHACGLEFRSDRLWENYIKWEAEGKRLVNVTLLYERLLATPTQGYIQHFDNFQEHVLSNPPQKVLEVDEFLALRKEVKALLKQDRPEGDESDKIPPGEDSDENTDEETKAIRERIISIRRKIHKNTSNAVTARWNFEEGIKRPYFHVKPLERCQLKNWQEYLDYEISQGEKTRIIVLFERCLIACALYEDFWLRFVHCLQGLEDEEMLPKIKDVYERACTIHHLKKPNIHLQWAMFEESVKNFHKAAEILQNLDKSVPNLLQVAYRRINLERRRGDNEKCCQLYDHYINNSKNKVISTNMAIKYARFSLTLLKKPEKAIEILTGAIAKDACNPRLYLQLLDVTLQKEEFSETDILQIIDSFLEKEGAEAEQKVLFAQRKLEFLEDFGSDINCLQKAYDEYQKYKGSKDSKKKDKAENAKKEKAQAAAATTNSNSYGNYSSYGTNSANTQSYQYGNSQQGAYNQYPQYGQGDQYQYGGWQYQGNYGGYNQWGGYGSGYSYPQ